MKKVALVTMALTMSGCATPPGVGVAEYYWGSNDPLREVALTCLRYPQHHPGCEGMAHEILQRNPRE